MRLWLWGSKVPCCCVEASPACRAESRFLEKLGPFLTLLGCLSRMQPGLAVHALCFEAWGFLDASLVVREQASLATRDNQNS